MFIQNGWVEVYALFQCEIFFCAKCTERADNLLIESVFCAVLEKIHHFYSAFFSKFRLISAYKNVFFCSAMCSDTDAPYKLLARFFSTSARFRRCLYNFQHQFQLISCKNSPNFNAFLKHRGLNILLIYLNIKSLKLLIRNIVLPPTPASVIDIFIFLICLLKMLIWICFWATLVQISRSWRGFKPTPLSLDALLDKFLVRIWLYPIWRDFFIRCTSCSKW